MHTKVETNTSNKPMRTNRYIQSFLRETNQSQLYHGNPTLSTLSKKQSNSTRSYHPFYATQNDNDIKCDDVIGNSVATQESRGVVAKDCKVNDAESTESAHHQTVTNHETCLNPIEYMCQQSTTNMEWISKLPKENHVKLDQMKYIYTDLKRVFYKQFIQPINSNALLEKTKSQINQLAKHNRPVNRPLDYQYRFKGHEGQHELIVVPHINMNTDICDPNYNLFTINELNRIIQLLEHFAMDISGGK